MHPDDARFELAIKNMKKVIACIDWSLLANDKEAGANTPDVRRPMAYAMFETLVNDLACNMHDNWHSFLREALTEVVVRDIAVREFGGVDKNLIPHLMSPSRVETFGAAIEALKRGEKVARAGWNGKGVFIWMPEPIDEFCTKVFTCGDDEYEATPWIGMKTADGKFVPWVASQTDMLAEDWQIVE